MQEPFFFKPWEVDDDYDDGEHRLKPEDKVDLLALRKMDLEGQEKRQKQHAKTAELKRRSK